MVDMRHLVCPHCATTNRVPANKSPLQARCGGCHRPLFDGHPAAVDAVRFEKHCRDNDIAVLVDVWAPWCGPCRTMASMFERAASALEPEVRLVKLNADEASEIASRLGVSGIPALLLLRGGHVVARTAGVMDAQRIVAWVRSNLAKAA
jgi:thioredoxin 2